MKFYFVIAAFLLLQWFGLSAQPVDKVSISMEEIGTQHGLSQGMVNCILKDRTGFVWIGTKDGLNRYDGYEFKVLRIFENDSSTMVDNYITSLFEDKDGMIWIGGMLNGITCYNPFSGTFMSLSQAKQLNRKLSGLSIRSIQQDSDGNIWVSSSGGIDVLNPSVAEYSGKKLNYPVRKLFSITSDIPKNAFDIQYWHFKNDNSLELYARNVRITITNPLNPALLQKTIVPISHFCQFNKDEIVHPVFDENQKRIYFFSASGITVYDQNEEKILSSLKISIDLSNFPSPILDKNGRIWVKTVHGLSLYDTESNTISKVISDNPIIENARFNDFSCAYKDANGIIWFGTYGYGIVKYVNDQEKFGHIAQYAEKPMSLSGIYETPTGDIVVQAYQTKNPIKCDLKKQVFTGEFSGFSEFDKNLRNGNTLVFDSNHAYVSHESVFKLNLDNNKYVKLNRPHEKPQIIYDPLFIDRMDRLWCADGFPGGIKELHRIDKLTGNIIESYQFPDSELHHEYRFVSDWTEDEKGNFWFGTLKGVYKFNPDSASWKIYSVSNRNEEREDVFSICFDQTYDDSILWVGTNGFGLQRLNITNNKFSSFNTSHGLPNDVIYGILSDNQKNLWLSTNRGLSLFNPRSKEIRNFTKSDGLQADEFNRYAKLKMSNGMLLFGGVNGLTFFNPEIFYEHEVYANTAITGLRINNEPVEPGQKINDRVLLIKPIEYTRKITLPYDVSMITLSFAYLNLKNPVSNSFRYRLKGFNEKWISTTGLHEATYTNLSPGTFLFEVMGKTSQGNWGSQSTLIELIILPPWWATWWFRTIAVLVFASFLYGLYRYRMAHLIGMERMRNRIAQDLHDEIGSTLSSISLYSAVMQKSTDNLPPKANDILGKIINSTSEIMEKMNDMVWTIKSDNDNFQHVVNRMRAFAVNMTDTTGITLHFAVGQKTESLKLDMDKRKNIYLIFKEAVNNAVKYSRCNNLHVSLTKNGYQLILEIRDDGIGFDLTGNSESTDLLGGNGIGGMKYRAKMLKAEFEISSVLNIGTSIVIAIPINH